MIIKFRAATNNDIPIIKSIVFDALQEYGLQPDGETTDQDLENIEVSYTDRSGYFCIAESAEGPVATGGLMRLSADRCELRKMYMIKAARGQGIGKQLLEYLLDRARRDDYKEVVLETASVLVEAIGLYKKYGFEPSNDLELSSRCDQAMILRL